MVISGVNDISPSPASQSLNSEGAKGEQVRNVNKIARNANTTRDQQEELEEFTEEQIEEGVETLNESVEALHKGLKFEIHEESDRMHVQVVDVIEDEVLKELPPEEILDMLGRIQEMVGIIIDEKV